jgi:hypothetical protein
MEQKMTRILNRPTLEFNLEIVNGPIKYPQNTPDIINPVQLN